MELERENNQQNTTLVTKSMPDKDHLKSSQAPAGAFPAHVGGKARRESSSSAKHDHSCTSIKKYR